MPTSRVNLDTTQYVRVTSDPLVASSLLIQSHRDTVRIAFSDVKPAKGNKVFHELGGEHPPFNIPRVDTAVWALATTDRCALTATQETLPVTPSSSFSEVATASITPIVQISAQYGKEDDLNIINSNGGSYVIEDSLYKVSSGTDPLGLSSLNAKRQAVYKPGQGLVGRLSAVFDTPTDLTLQAAGLITSEDSFTFGYLNEDFGIIRAFGGVVEAQELTITTAGNGTLVLVINDVGYNVPITTGTPAHNAWQIAEYFRLNPAENYLITSNSDTVFFMNTVPGPQGVFTYSGATGFVGTFNQVATGVDVSIEFTPQSSFNRDLVTWLLPQSGNVYEIKFSYLGFSSIEFYIKDPATNKNTLVHVMDYSGNSKPIVRNPTFRIGWVARNLGSTTNVTVSGASAMSANEGIIVNDNPTRAVENLDVLVGSDLTNLISIRNRFHFGGIINRANVKPTLLSFATDDTRGALFSVIANPTFSGDLNYEYVDKENSIVEVAYDTVQITGGRVIASFNVSRNAPLNLASTDFATILEPDQVFAIAAKVKSGANEEMDATVVFLEDL